MLAFQPLGVNSRRHDAEPTSPCARRWLVTCSPKLPSMTRPSTTRCRPCKFACLSTWHRPLLSADPLGSMHAAWATTRTSSTPIGRRPTSLSTAWACTRTCCVASMPTVRALESTTMLVAVSGFRSAAEYQLCVEHDVSAAHGAAAHYQAYVCGGRNGRLPRRMLCVYNNGSGQETAYLCLQMG